MDQKYCRLNLRIYLLLLRALCIVAILQNSTSAFAILPCGYNDENAEKSDPLPNVLSGNHSDLAGCRLKLEAASLFALHQLPGTKKDWITTRAKLITEINRITGVLVNHALPLNLRETGRIQMKGYSIRNIYFQTRPGVSATANLYIPDGEGRFPAVIVMMGHSRSGRLDEKYQALGHTLALNGYVSLCIDPWGSGERTTTHGLFEDHGDENNLGSSLMNIGEPLMGIELSDNMRGVDLLCSLPYVDSDHIGATGSSGGGNQTMWLAAMDDRIKAAVPVVSAGTFESYIWGTPCICEVLPGGLNLTEEAGILSLIAPRALKMSSHQKDNNQAFKPSEMIRSYRNAVPIFDHYGVSENIGYEIFDLTHGYFPQDREVMLGWFDLHLRGKGDGSSKKEVPFELLPPEKLMVFAQGDRSPEIMSTAPYCVFKGNELRKKFLNLNSLNIEAKKNQLREILGIKSKSCVKTVHEFLPIQGWNRIAIETSENNLIPLLIHLPSGNQHEFVILCNPEGKKQISKTYIDQLIGQGKGIAIPDLSGTGEMISAPNNSDKNGNLLTLSRSLLWFGKTIIGEWVNELDQVSTYLHTKYHADKISVDASKEAGVAALFLSALDKRCEKVTLRLAPVSYLFDTRENIDFFSMGINIPGILKWGDISLAAALSSSRVTFVDPVTMSGKKLNPIELNNYEVEFKSAGKLTNNPGRVIFVNSDKME